jgi:hypothetical protein
MATKVIATATVRAVKRRLIPTRAAITLVSSSKRWNFYFFCLKYLKDNAKLNENLFLDTISN